MGAVMLKSLGFLASWIVLVILCSAIPLIDSPGFLGGNGAFLRLWWELFPCLAVLIPSFLFARGIEKGRVRIPLSESPGRDAVIGLSLGVLWIGISTGVLYLFGFIHFQEGKSVEYPSVWFVAALLNVVMQEYLVRGYLFQLIRTRVNAVVAVTSTTILFVLFHGGAVEAGIVAVLNVLTMSVFASLLLLYTKGLLAPILAHFVWNAVGSIVLGAVSLADDYPRMLESTFSGSAWFTGGSVKIEGSVVVLIANLLLISAIGFALKKGNMSTRAMIDDR